MKFYILDVFGEKKYRGNQLAVVVLDRDMDTKDMQKIAREFNFSETTFINPEPLKDGTFHVRIFSPDEELPFAGHPSLGSAFVINNYLSKDRVTSIQLKVEAGIIPVSFNNNGVLWMKQLEPIFKETYSPEVLASVLGLSISEIDREVTIQRVSTGLDVILVPLTGLAAVKRARLIKILDLPIMVFSRETYTQEASINCRFFGEAVGITEDPATGSANGCLAAYISRYRYLGSGKIDIQCEQGWEINRPSTLYLKASPIGDSFNIEVGGRVIPVAKGELC